MSVLLNASDDNFEATLTKRLAADLQHEKADKAAAEILADVRKNGDKAVIAYTKQFDRLELSAEQLRIPEDEINAAYEACDHTLLDALELAAMRITAYHKKQLPDDEQYVDELGVRLGWQWRAVDAVGLYIPGGLASYPSSVLMNAIPAKVAGVDRIAAVVPTPDGKLNPVVLAAAKIAGITELYRIGGAQAIGALAYGTATIPKVDTIVGPGNAYVAAAKKQVYGIVGIDCIAGPSEILVIADNENNPDWIAADLLSQAEHDPLARSILVTNDEAYAKQVIASVEATIPTLDRADIAQQSWNDCGTVIVTSSLEDAANIANIVAPEHLELAVQKPRELLKHIRHAGAIFLGRHTPEAIGDYTAGPSHVLPTAGAPRFSSGLSVYDFLKRSSIIGCSEESFDILAAPTARLANAEGLGAHALSVTIRKDKA